MKNAIKFTLLAFFAHSFALLSAQNLTWTEISPAAAGKYFDMHWLNDSTGFVVGQDGSNFYCYRTSDGAASWSSSQLGAEMRRVFFVDAMEGFAAGPTGVFSKTTDGGVTWSTPVSFIQGSMAVSLADMQFPSSQVGYITTIDGNGGKGYKTSDGGATWALVDFPIPANFIQSATGTVTRKPFWFTSPLRGFAGRRRGWLHHTSDGAVTWDSIPVDTNYVPVVFDFLDASNAFACGPTATYTTSDGGMNWTARTGMSQCGEANEYVGSTEYHTVSVQLTISTWETYMDQSTDNGQTYTAVTPAGGTGTVATVATDDLDFPTEQVGYALVKDPDFQNDGHAIWKTDLGSVSIDRPVTTRLDLFPNPVQNSLRLRIPQESLQSVKVIDVKGQVIFQQNEAGTYSEATLEIAQLSPGVYLVQVQTASGRRYSSKFLKSR